MLTEALLRVYFGRSSAPDEVQIGLALAGAETSVEGYERQSVERGRWEIVGDAGRGEARARVRFGPFADRVVVDEAWLFVDGEPLEVGGRFDPPRELNRGDEFEFTYHSRIG